MRSFKFAAMLLLAFLLSVSTTAVAEIYNCDGLWTARPCSDSSVPSLSENERTEKSEISKRKLWLHDLDMLRLRTKRELSISPSIREVETLCLDLSRSALDCSQAVSAKETELNQLLLENKKLKVAEERNRIEEEKNSSTDGAEGTVTSVTVINREKNIYILPRKPRHPSHSNTEVLPTAPLAPHNASSASQSSEPNRKPIRKGGGVGLPGYGEK